MEMLRPTWWVGQFRVVMCFAVGIELITFFWRRGVDKAAKDVIALGGEMVRCRSPTRWQAIMH
jgi:hypothetical protein